MKPSLTVIRIGLSSLICTALLSACGPGFKSKNFTNAESDAYFKANPQFAHLDKRNKAAAKQDDAGKDASGGKDAAPKAGAPADGAKSNTIGEELTPEQKTAANSEFNKEVEEAMAVKVSAADSVIKGIQPNFNHGALEIYTVADINGDKNLITMDLQLEGSVLTKEMGKTALKITMKDKEQNAPTNLMSGVAAHAICDADCSEIVVLVDVPGRKQKAVFVVGSDNKLQSNVEMAMTYEEALAAMGPKGFSKGYEAADKPAQTSQNETAAPVAGQVEVSKTEEAVAAKGDLQEQVQEASEQANAKMDLTGVEQIVVAANTGIPASIAATDAQIEEVKSSDGGLVVLPEVKAALETKTAVEEKRTQVSFNGAIVNMTPSELKAKQAELARVQQASLNEKVAKGRTAPTWQSGSQATELASKKNSAKTR